jgi:hypothetical protein
MSRSLPEDAYAMGGRDARAATARLTGMPEHAISAGDAVTERRHASP